MARGMSQPSVMFKGTLQNGETIIVRDYVDAYEWLRDNTPEDSRVMAWWDYGYQITGIANRTSIADGNTWNHEHIANLARSLTATEERGHRVIRHLADYVLVWTGGGADDMAKSPHLFRIGKSIGHDGGTVDMYEIQSKFGVDRYGRPTPMMAQSLLYKLVSFEGKVSEERFQEVYTSKYRKVRIYKVVNVSEKSKRWLADPANRLCDAPGSWYCPGQYPPALAKFTGIIKEAYQMPTFHRERMEAELKREEERRRRAKEAKAAAAAEAAEAAAAAARKAAEDGPDAKTEL
jgi:dolichyl-diphosphooligosaccharide--protein glycosyltransferase